MNEFEQLTSLLSATKETKRLERLEKRLNDVSQRSQEIAAILPTALRVLPDMADFTSALQSPLESSLKELLQHDPHSFVEGILPLMGPILHKTTAETIQPIKEALQAQQTHLSDLEKYQDSFEKGFVHQQKLHRSLDKHLNEFELTYINQFNQLQNLLQTQQTQLSDFEQYLDNLEKVSVNQRMQLGNFEQAQQVELQEIKKYLKTLKQTHINQETQLSALEQYLNKLEKVQVNQYQQLKEVNQRHHEAAKKAQINQQGLYRSLNKQIKLVFQALKTNINTLDKHVNSLEQTQVLPSQVNDLLKRFELCEQSVMRYEQLENRLNSSKQRALEIAKILPKAIDYASQQATQPAILAKDQELTDSLRGPVEMCLKESIRQDTSTLAQSLFPVIGPMIRKYINEAFKVLLQEINTTLERTFSVQRLAWRMQALRSGRPYSEIVLTNTFIYRVEQVFLIHRESGLLIHHANIDNIEIGDSDAVSAMLTAIQDFIRDSFSSGKNEELNSVEVGDCTVWLERGPYAVLACVIRGIAPLSLRESMSQLIEFIHAQSSELLENFSGDNTPLQSCLPLLENALQSEEKKKAMPRLFSPQLFVVFIIILLALAGWGYHYFEYQQRLNHYITALHETPGIVVLSSESKAGKLEIQGMRDPLAEEPQEIARRFKLNDNDVVFKARTYQDLNSLFVEKRLLHWLKPPPTVQMSLKGRSLYLSGHADQAWIDKVNNSIGMIAGLTEVVTDKLINTEIQFKAFLKTLDNTPGIMVVSSSHENGQRFVTGMRDPLADAPEEIAQQNKISDVNMRWTPYQDLTPQFIEKRVRLRLVPPSTVEIRLVEDTLHLSGHAQKTWIDKAINNAPSIAGINRVEIKQLVDTDSFLLLQVQRTLKPPESVTLSVHNSVLRVIGQVNSATFQTLQQRIQAFQNSQKELAGIETSGLVDIEHEMRVLVQSVKNQKIYFYEDSTKLTSEQETALAKLLKDLQHLLTLGQMLNQIVELQITGNTDGLGTELYNQQLSQRRAEVIINWLEEQGIKKHFLTIIPPSKIRFGETRPNPRYRNVNFSVITYQ
ncbi:MAG: OmpA family protein [Candidatus Parabeggiatoa sp.]|nr:OmpA family protein [Candidatus Parabeggiatoa sp.]